MPLEPTRHSQHYPLDTGYLQDEKRFKNGDRNVWCVANRNRRHARKEMAPLPTSRLCEHLLGQQLISLAHSLQFKDEENDLRRDTPACLPVSQQELFT